MAGWDLPFDCRVEDEELARQCFRVLRRTCARHYLGFKYHLFRRNSNRVVFYLEFDGQPHMLGLAAADFAIEMHAVSLIQRTRRQQRLPLRLLAWVTYSGSEEPLRLQSPSDRVPVHKRDRVIKHLEEYALAWGAWLRGDISPADYLEAQHSILTNIAVDLAPGVSNRTPYPELIKALRIPHGAEAECLQLGRDRNRVKHRGMRHEAARYAEQYVQPVYSTLEKITGIDTMPRTAYMQRWELDTTSSFRTEPMYSRYGEPKRFTRY